MARATFSHFTLKKAGIDVANENILNQETRGQAERCAC